MCSLFAQTGVQTGFMLQVVFVDGKQPADHEA
jgi:hypothetical protein